MNAGPARWARGLIALALSFCACTDRDTAADSGPLDAGGDAALAQCEQAADCDDGLHCTTHTCEPGAAGADARGCVSVEGPCAPGERCVEVGRQCVPADCLGAPDADGDGHDAISCGGDDCDDFDPDRYPGNTEVCDAVRHDEDCDDSTFGDTDVDGDGFVDQLCCNGGLCGDDCADADRDVAPGATETCDAVDEDCDGVVDEAAGEPLCPGGVCRSGRCDLRQWDRTFGGPTNEEIIASTIDSRGNVYILGEFGGSVLRVGDESIEGQGFTDAFLVSFRADGTYRWVLPFATPGRDRAGGVTYHAESDLLLVQVSTESQEEIAPGISPQRDDTLNSAYLIALDTDGVLTWHRELLAATVGAVSASGVAAGLDIVAIGRLSIGTFAVDGAVGDTIATAAETYVATYSRSGEQRSLIHFESSALPAVAADVSGNSYLADGHAGLSSFGASGTLRWRALEGADVGFVTVSRDRVLVTGTFDEPLDLGGGVLEGEAGEGHNVFVAALSPDGNYQQATTWVSAPGSQLGFRGVAVDSTDAVIVTGSFGGTVDFGGGPRSSAPGNSAFYAVLSADLVHRSDAAFVAAVCPTAFCPSFPYDVDVGPADTTVIVGTFGGAVDLGSGPRTSVGSLDGFVVRLSN